MRETMFVTSGGAWCIRWVDDNNKVEREQPWTKGGETTDVRESLIAFRAQIERSSKPFLDRERLVRSAPPSTSTDLTPICHYEQKLKRSTSAFGSSDQAEYGEQLFFLAMRIYGGRELGQSPLLNLFVDVPCSGLLVCFS